MSTVQEFYDDLAANYHLMFADWQQAVHQQSETLNTLIQARFGGTKPQTLLDCTCGIGTQAIGLALQKYKVTASDFSPKALERAQQEAKKFGVEFPTYQADLRTLDQTIQEQFDVVISCDNSLSHLYEPGDLLKALQQIKARVRPGGLFVASIRDYDAVKNPQAAQVAQKLPGDYSTNTASLPTATLPRVFNSGGNKRVVFQLWDWAPDSKSYQVSHFTLVESGSEWKTYNQVSRFLALQRAELTDVLQTAGFYDIQWQMPGEIDFYQPVVTAKS